MDIPLAKKLRKRAHLEVALLQDEVVELVYALCPEMEPALHGGTAIWRCYNGKRFSEDLDFYGKIPEGFKEKLGTELESRGLVLGKYKKSPHVLFVKIRNNSTEVKLEISEGVPAKKILLQYEKTDGTKMDIYSLSRKELITEKMKAYLNRRFVRDIYDVYLLGKEEGKVPEVLEFLEKIEQPVDEKNLKALVYSGVVPSFREMKNVLKGLQ
mgnify:CR=1 FL=1